MISFYQSIVGDKDELIKQDFPCTQFVDNYDKFKDPRRNSRIQKILSHKYFDSEFTIYADGNIKLLISPEEMVKRYMDGYDMAMFGHALRDCIYDEALVCAQLKLDDPEIIIEQAKYYEDHGFPKHIGLRQCGIIMRRNNERTRRFNEAWWADYCRFSRRDQLSAMPAIDESGVILNNIPEMWKMVGDRALVVDVAEMFHHKSLEGNFNDPNNV